MRQDKFVELRIAQLHWNAVPRLAFGHLDPESIEILADSPHIDKRQTCKGFQTNSRAGKTCNQLIDNSSLACSAATCASHQRTGTFTGIVVIDRKRDPDVTTRALAPGGAQMDITGIETVLRTSSQTTRTERTKAAETCAFVQYVTKPA